jgi:hypothetical protein
LGAFAAKPQNLLAKLLKIVALPGDSNPCFRRERETRGKNKPRGQTAALIAFANEQ